MCRDCRNLTTSSSPLPSSIRITCLSKSPQPTTRGKGFQTSHRDCDCSQATMSKCFVLPQRNKRGEMEYFSSRSVSLDNSFDSSRSGSRSMTSTSLRSGGLPSGLKNLKVGGTSPSPGLGGTPSPTDTWYRPELSDSPSAFSPISRNRTRGHEDRGSSLSCGSGSSHVERRHTLSPERSALGHSPTIKTSLTIFPSLTKKDDFPSKAGQSSTPPFTPMSDDGPPSETTETTQVRSSRGSFIHAVSNYMTKLFSGGDTEGKRRISDAKKAERRRRTSSGSERARAGFKSKRVRSVSLIADDGS
jgi:hypothetical protein